jgi:hypothetical protein
MARVIVYHREFGCDTGCCGHVVDVDGAQEFYFEHPYGDPPRKFAEDLVRSVFGEEHVADLDWENSLVVED